jgi:hypothetical protein
VHPDDVVAGELAENVHRKDFLPSELWAVAKEVMELVQAPPGRPGKTVENCHRSKGKTGDKAAASFGVSGRTLDKIGAVCEGGFPHLVEQLDAEPRSVHRCYRRLRALRQQRAERRARGRAGAAGWVVTGEQAVVRCQLLLADPPHGITDQPREPDDLGAFTRGWCGRWSGCGADFVALFWSQARLWEGRDWSGQSLAGYRLQQVLAWHAGNAWSPKSRPRFKESWRSRSRVEGDNRTGKHRIRGGSCGAILAAVRKGDAAHQATPFPPGRDELLHPFLACAWPTFRRRRQALFACPRSLAVGRVDGGGAASGAAAPALPSPSHATVA